VYAVKKPVAYIVERLFLFCREKFSLIPKIFVFGFSFVAIFCTEKNGACFSRTTKIIFKIKAKIKTQRR
jgi:hypothetical protein